MTTADNPGRLYIDFPDLLFISLPSSVYILGPPLNSHVLSYSVDVHATYVFRLCSSRLS